MFDVLAHGIGGVQDLPVPRWLFYWGAAVALAASFALLGSLWRQPLLAHLRDGRELAAGFSTVVLGPFRIGAQVASVCIFALVWSTALFGSTDSFENLSPTWIYVAFWLGLPLLSVTLGDVWRALSPWRALADGFVWVWERTGRVARPLAHYPERIGRWPAAVALLAFVTLELAYADPANPRVLALAIALYTYVSLFGMVAFGRETWVQNAEGFAVAFTYLSHLAPLHAEGGRLRLRWPITGLARADRTTGATAVVAMMLGSVLFDGYSRTASWQNLMADLEGPYLDDRPSVGELLVTLAGIGGLVVCAALVGLAFAAACAIARAT